MLPEDVNVFVSYSHEDRDLVSPIVRLLSVMRSNVFIDLTSIDPGSIWLDSVREAIRNAHVVLVFWCEHSAQSSWVKTEWELGLDSKKKVIPLLLDETILDVRLSEYQGIDFRALKTHAPLRLHSSLLVAIAGLYFIGAVSYFIGLVPFLIIFTFGILIGILSRLLFPKQFRRSCHVLEYVWRRILPNNDIRMAWEISKRLEDLASETNRGEMTST